MNPFHIPERRLLRRNDIGIEGIVGNVGVQLFVAGKCLIAPEDTP